MSRRLVHPVERVADTCRRYPRSLSDAFADERAHCIEPPDRGSVPRFDRWAGIALAIAIGLGLAVVVANRL